MSEENIFCNTQIRNQVQFLMDDIDACFLRFLGCAELNRLSVHIDFTGIPLVYTAQDLDQCRFAGAVLSKQYMDFSSAERKRNVIECLYARELNRYVIHDNNVSFIHQLTTFLFFTFNEGYILYPSLSHLFIQRFPRLPVLRRLQFLPRTCPHPSAAEERPVQWCPSDPETERRMRTFCLP